MWPRFYKSDLPIIAHYLGSLVLLMGCVMLIPLLVGCAMQEWAIVSHYVVGLGIALVVGSLLRLCKISPTLLNRRQAIAITGLAWMVCALIGSVPLWLSGMFDSYLDSFFESVSGLTSTGMTMIRDVDHLSTADSMWRFSLQFLGGQGVVVIALSLGLFTKGGTSFYDAEGRNEHILPNIKNTAQFIWQFSSLVILAGTVIMALVMLFKGMEPARSLFHGLWITVGSYDTGGFSPQSSSMMYYHSWVLELIAMLFMLMGAVNFTLYARVWKGSWRELLTDIETRTLAIWIVLLLVIFVAALNAGEYLNGYTSLVRRGVFTIVSAATNAGYQVLTTNQMLNILTSGAFFMIAVAMVMGGSAGSTSGGIKALRVGIIAKGIAAKIKGVLAPESARITTSYNHAGRQLLSNDMLSAAMVIAALYVISYLLGTLIGIAYGYEAIPATFESIAAASNAGLSAGIATPDAPVVLKIVYIMQMWMGRLEFLTLLALFASFFASFKPRPKAGRWQR